MFSNPTPATRKAWICAAVTATLIYLGYRTAFTLNLATWYATTASVTLLIAEVYGCFLMFLYFFQIWELVEPQPVPPLVDRSVDVYIPTYNEDPELLRGTISAAVALDYPHKTYVLDDGDRPAVKKLAADLGADYIARPSSLHAKAGNLNHAMEITSGEFVVIFDADHVSRRDFITRLLGYFADDRLGFVQTPHSFYNFDNFQGMLNYKKQRYWEEGELFYNVTQPGKNRWNAVSFCGSAAMFRRAALEDVGLVATETITEDMHTGLRMHAKGWNSLFVNERLVSGQAATDVSTFNTQRLRWGEGNLGVMAYDNPLTMKGLTIAQRLGYLGSMLSWTTGLQKLMLYISPMLMLFTGVAPVSNMSWMLGIITAVYLIIIWTTVTLTANGHGHLIGTELTHMASFWTQIKSTYRAVFKRRKTTFVVTSKRGRQTNSIRRFIMPQCTYIAGGAVAIAWASVRYAIGLSNDLPGLCVGSFLVCAQGAFAFEVIRRALRSGGTDDAWRHPVAAHVDYQYTDMKGNQVEATGVTFDLNENGVGLHVFEDLTSVKDITLNLSVMGLRATTRGRIIHRQLKLESNSARDGEAHCWAIGVKFEDTSQEDLGKIWRICSDYAVARMYDAFEYKKRHGATDSVSSLLAASAVSENRITLPIQVEGASVSQSDPDSLTAWHSVTEGITKEGCTLLMTAQLEVNQPVFVTLGTPLGAINATAWVAASRQVILGATTMEFVELTFSRFKGECRSRLLSLLGASAENDVRSVVTLRPREKELQNFRPALVTGMTGAIAASIAAAAMFGLHQDDWLLSRIGGEETLQVAEAEQLDELMREVMADPNADERRLVRLREIYRNVGDDDRLAQLDEILVQRDVLTFAAKLARAQTFDGLGRYDEAASLYDELLLSTEPIRDDQQFALFISAARNHANRGHGADAAALFEQLPNDRFATEPALLREYAGVLASADQTDRAVKLIHAQKNLTIADRSLLGDLYASRHDFAKAKDQYERILGEQPDNLNIQTRLADTMVWMEDFNPAVALLDQLWRDQPTSAIRERLAFAHLWNHNGVAAVDRFETLLGEHPKRRDYADGYVEACLLVDDLTVRQTALLTAILDQYPPRGDLETQKYAGVMSRHGLNEPLRPLLMQMVAQSPDQIDLRLRLVDLLQNLGEHRQAADHLRVLASLTSAPTREDRLIRAPSVEELVDSL